MNHGEPLVHEHL